MDRAGIVIVTYNSAGHIGRCVESALATGADVVVVDNASSDATVSEATRPGVRILANPDNRGFAAAVNQGIACLNAPYILLLNPDAEIVAGFDALCAACDQPGVAGSSGCLLGTDGRPQTGFMVRRLPTPGALALEALLLNRIWPENPINRRFRALDLDYRAAMDVEQPAGAFLMIRRDAWQRLGGFDEGYFPLWFEDVDFCRRAADAGYRFRYEPRAVAKHAGGHSIPAISMQMRPLYWYRSLLRYTALHFRRWEHRCVCAAVAAGSAMRMLVAVVSGRTLRPVTVYGRVVRLACRMMASAARSKAVEAI
jgi:N-acetylglucosaminyl-diphospho-decaprenol L-rhamnosyltransferase